VSAVVDSARAIYDERYAERYPSLYIAPWAAKHERNRAIVDGLLAERDGESPRWLDLACGQGWHFSQFPGRARMLGVDVSEAQLARARALAGHASFLCADMAELSFAPASFDLVTSFWAAYCYLRDTERILGLVRSAADWLAEGGAMYLEVLLGADLASFNRSRFSGRTGFEVHPLSADYSRWSYDDSGGRHVMTSPPVERFLEVLRPRFDSVHAQHDGAFMVHVVARGRASRVDR
jgi:SAM-dependent methyltransferase